MIPGINSHQMRQMMRRMGIAQQELEATEVIIKMHGKQLIFKNPQVSKVNMMGQDTYQIVGASSEESLDTKPEINSEDIKTVSTQANVSEEEAKKAIEDANGDLAEAILKLKS